MKYLVYFVFTALLLISSTKPPLAIELQLYYEESCGLSDTSGDSVISFSDKFSDATRGMDYREDPYYQPALNNIDSAAKLFEA